MSLIGYARVSTAEGRQVLDRQLDALNAAGCERMFEDHASGATPGRQNLAACLDYLRRGEVLVVLDLDRLGRLAGERITLIDELGERGILPDIDPAQPAIGSTRDLKRRYQPRITRPACAMRLSHTRPHGQPRTGSRASRRRGPGRAGRARSPERPPGA